MNMRPEIMKAALSSKSKLVFLKFANYFIGLIVVVVLARSLGAEGFGTYSFVYSLALVLVVPAGIGLPAFVLRETAIRHKNGDFPGIWEIWTWASRVIALSSIVIVAAALLVFAVAEIGPATLSQLAIGVAMIPLFAAGRVRGAALQAIGYPFQSKFPQLVARPALHVALFLAIIGLWGAQPTATLAITTNFVAALLSFILGLWLLMRYAPAREPAQNQNTEPRKWLASTAWLGVAKGARTVNYHIGVLILGALGTAADVGLYKAALLIGGTVLFGGTAIKQAMSPRFARGKDSLPKLRRQTVRSARQIASFGLLMMLIIVFAGHDILRIALGAEYVDAYHALMIAAFGKASYFAFGPVSSLLTMTGREKLVVRVLVESVVLNVVLCLILVPVFGIIGAALGWSVSAWYANARLYLLVRKHLGFDSSFIGMR